jgi:hypothetical protein
MNDLSENFKNSSGATKGICFQVPNFKKVDSG